MRKKDTWHAPDPDLFHVAAEVVVLGTIKSLNCQTTVINYKLEKRERAEGILYNETKSFNDWEQIEMDKMDNFIEKIFSRLSEIWSEFFSAQSLHIIRYQYQNGKLEGRDP